MAQVKDEEVGTKGVRKWLLTMLEGRTNKTFYKPDLDCDSR